MSGSIIVKIELPLDLYGKLARATNSEVGRLLRTLATRAARMESEKIKSITSPTTQQSDDNERYFSTQQTERTRERVKFIESELAKGRRVIDIAGDLGITDGAVYQHMKREGLKSIAKYERSTRTKAEREAQVRELWLRHHSGAEIARQLNMPSSTVRAIVNTLNREDQIS